MRVALFTAIGAVLAATLVATVAAAPSPLSPKAGSTLTTSHPTFRWKLASTEAAESVSIASSPAIGSTGDFAKTVDADILQADSTSWTPTRALPAGKYWWHVASHSNAVGSPPDHLFSPAVPFTVKAVISVGSIAFKTAGRQFLATISFKANVRNVVVVKRLYKGTKVLGTQKSLTDNFILDQSTQDQSMWTVPSSVKHGTPLKLVFTLTIKGSTTKLTTSKTLRAP
jgi:hypothetical protein